MTCEYRYNPHQDTRRDKKTQNKENMGASASRVFRTPNDRQLVSNGSNLRRLGGSPVRALYFSPSNYHTDSRPVLNIQPRIRKWVTSLT